MAPRGCSAPAQGVARNAALVHGSLAGWTGRAVACSASRPLRSLREQSPGHPLTRSLCCASALSQTLVQTIARGVFEVIVDQSPFVPEETAKEQKIQVGGGSLSEEEASGNEMTWCNHCHCSESRGSTLQHVERAGKDQNSKRTVGFY